MKIPSLAELQQLKVEAEKAAKDAKRETLAAYNIIVHFFEFLPETTKTVLIEDCPDFEDDLNIILYRYSQLCDEFNHAELQI